MFSFKATVMMMFIHAIPDTHIMQQYGYVWEMPEKAQFHIPDIHFAIQFFTDLFIHLADDGFLINAYISKHKDV